MALFHFNDNFCSFTYSKGPVFELRSLIFIESIFVILFPNIKLPFVFYKNYTVSGRFLTDCEIVQHSLNKIVIKH